MPPGQTGCPWQQTFLGPGKSSIDPSKAILTRLRFKPTGNNEASAFRRIMRPQGVALPVIGIAVRLTVENGKIVCPRVAIGPAGPTPFPGRKNDGLPDRKRRLPKTPAGKPSIPLLEEVNLRNSRHRASAEYRVEMIKSELPRTLMAAIERAVRNQGK